MIILNIEDFTKISKAGIFKIPLQNGCEPILQNYIDRYEKRYLQNLLGCELAELFISDLIEGIPQTERFINLYNEICEDLDKGVFNYCCYYKCSYNLYCKENYNCCLPKKIESRGIKSMLQGFIYWEYNRKANGFSKTPSGTKKNNSENSQNVTFPSWGLFDYYNESQQDYTNIQYYIFENEEVYPEYNGERKLFSNPIC